MAGLGETSVGKCSDKTTQNVRQVIAEINTHASDYDGCGILNQLKTQLRTERNKTVERLSNSERKHTELIRNHYAAMRKQVDTVYRGSLVRLNETTDGYQAHMRNVDLTTQLGESLISSARGNASSLEHIGGLLKALRTTQLDMKSDIDSMPARLRRAVYVAQEMDAAPVGGTCQTHVLSCSSDEGLACLSEGGSCSEASSETADAELCPDMTATTDAQPCPDKTATTDAEPCPDQTMTADAQPQEPCSDLRSDVLKTIYADEGLFTVMPCGDIVSISYRSVRITATNATVDHPKWCKRWSPCFVSCQQRQLLIVNCESSAEGGGVYLYDADYRFNRAIRVDKPKHAALARGGDIVVVTEPQRRWDEWLHKYNRENVRVGFAKNIEMVKTSYVAISPHRGDVIITHPGGVIAFASDLTARWQYPCRRGGKGKLRDPRGVCIDATGSVLVADYDGDCLLELSQEGAFIRMIDLYDLGVVMPSTLLLCDDDQLWISRKCANGYQCELRCIHYNIL